jgi:hypothetical protein
VADPLGGVVDSFPSLGNAAFQLLNTGKFRDDCDGLAYFSAANVEPFCDRPEDRYLVTELLNPFEAGWADAAHVMLFLRQGGQWRVIQPIPLRARLGQLSGRPAAQRLRGRPAGLPGRGTDVPVQDHIVGQARAGRQPTAALQ